MKDNCFYWVTLNEKPRYKLIVDEWVDSRGKITLKNHVNHKPPWSGQGDETLTHFLMHGNELVKCYDEFWEEVAIV